MALFATVVLILGGLITHGHFAGSGDAVHYMVVAQSAAFDLDLDLADDYGEHATLILNGRIGPEAHALPGATGALRPVHDIGWPVLSAPLFAVAYLAAEHIEAVPEGLRRKARVDKWMALRQLTSLLMICVSGGLALLSWRTLRQLGHGSAAAGIFAAAITLTTPVLSMAYVYMPDIPGAALTMALFLGIVMAARHGTFQAALLGLGVGALVLLHVRNAGLAVGFVIIALRRLGPAQRLVFLGAATVGIALRTVVNLGFWGTPLTTPHAAFGASASATALLAESAVRLMGLVFDQRHGLLPQAPAYLLVPAGIMLLRRRHPRAAHAVALLTVAYLVPIVCPLSNIHGWRGGWSPAARFLLPVAPLWGLCVAETLGSGARRPLALLIGAAHLGVAALAWTRPMLTWSEGPGVARIYSESFLAPLTRVLPGWQPSLPGSAVLSVLLAGTALALAFAARPATHSSPPGGGTHGELALSS